MGPPSWPRADAATPHNGSEEWAAANLGAVYYRDRDQLVVVGSKGGSDTAPAWLLNLQANPNVEVRVARKRFPARARIATPAERRRLWPVMTAIWPAYELYQARTRRKIPLVILDRSGFQHAAQLGVEPEQGVSAELRLSG